MAAHPDLQSEQAYIDRAYERLAAMRRAAEDLRDSVIDSGKGGTFQARVERDVIVEASLQRLEKLQLGRSSLCFGRIDREPAEPGAGPERFYVGRLAVSDENQEPLVVDWRAPIAESFYRATGRAPMGLRRRRHFATDGRLLLDIEDELFQADGSVNGSSEDFELVGPGALLAALQRSRSGHMRDIVATVQREQDEIIRGELPGILVVQGGPGTGKTAVALHRAAYLLYTHRFLLDSQGVLVVGPNQLFLRYIEQVLPSLGESGVVLTTIAGLMSGTCARGHEDPAAERVKGDARMAKVLAQGVQDRQRPLRTDLVVGYGSYVLRVRARHTHGIVQAAKRRGGTHNSRRRVIESLLVRALYDAYNAGVERNRRNGISAQDLELADFSSDIRREPEVIAALDRMWPILTAEDYINDLLGAPALLALATEGLLSTADRNLLARPRAHSIAEVAWTPADLPLLDEARSLLGSTKVRRRRNGSADDDEPRGYGHIVVDEAQDVSPMALRMLGRRSISGSMTLVGDIAQATAGRATQSWDDILRHLPARRPPRTVTLTVNYRTPAEIMDIASSVLDAADVPGVESPRSVRSTATVPVVTSTKDPAEAAAVAAVSELTLVSPGNVAIIAPTEMLGAVASALDASGTAWGEPERDGLSAPITLLDVPDAKGLEFDSVVVVEPAALGGLRQLYVALTRTTNRLVIVHAQPLPDSLDAGLSGRERSGLSA